MKEEKWYGPMEWVELLEQVLQACKHTDFVTSRIDGEYPNDPFHWKMHGLSWAESEFEELLGPLVKSAKDALEIAEWWASAADDAGEL